MRLPGGDRYRHALPQLQMTPMIDVVFQLLIFFVCTASFQQLEELLPTPLASGGSIATAELAPELEELEEIVVTLRYIDAKPQWELNGRQFTQLELLAEPLRTLAGIRSDLPVILDVGSDVPLGYVIDLYDLCRVAGFDQVQFAASVDV